MALEYSVYTLIVVGVGCVALDAPGWLFAAFLIFWSVFLLVWGLCMAASEGDRLEHEHRRQAEADQRWHDMCEQAINRRAAR